MIKVSKWLLLGVLALMGLAWKLVQGFFALMPDNMERMSSVDRCDVPWEPGHASHTRDGRRIIG